MSDFVELDSSYQPGLHSRAMGGHGGNMKERLITSSKDAGAAAKYHMKR